MRRAAPNRCRYAVSPAAAALAALLAAIVISCTSQVNVGMIAVALAWGLGLYTGRTADAVLAGFPASLFVTLAGVTPVVHETAWVAPSADLVGAVDLRAGSSVWYTAVLRADVDPIVLGERSNLQDGVVVHTDAGHPTTIGSGVSVGHRAVLHSCTIEDDCLVGMGAVVLNGAHIGAGSLIAAGAVVPEGAVIPPRSLLAGVPGRVRREIDDPGLARIRANAEVYLELARRHREATAP